MGNLLQRLWKESHYHIIREFFQTVRSYEYRIWFGEHFGCQRPKSTWYVTLFIKIYA